MNKKEALIRVTTGNFNDGYGFDWQLLIDTVGVLGEMFRNGQISEIVYCKDCRSYDEQISMCDNCGLPREQTFFCADGKRREENDKNIL